ncbi:hypothetical protein HK096_008180 [Nowakowskiella sp. JEL0078]|nr:hypothetical protein HK096_008180 [Nowakowskiella sp. JEL0078]
MAECLGTRLKSILSQYKTLTERLLDSYHLLALLHSTSPTQISLLNLNVEELSGLPERIILDLVSLDSELNILLNDLEYHQHLQNKIVNTQHEIFATNSEIIRLVECLKSSEFSLNQLLLVAGEQVKTMRKANDGAVDHKRLVSYAQRIARYTSAPHNWAPGQNVPVFPPIPQDMHMKTSLLFQADRAKAEIDALNDEELEKNDENEMDIFGEAYMATSQNIENEDISELLDLDI